MIRRKSLTWRAAAAAKEDAAVTDVKNLENELGLCEMKNYAKKGKSQLRIAIIRIPVVSK